jgi:hypothetical protein
MQLFDNWIDHPDYYRNALLPGAVHHSRVLAISVPAALELNNVLHEMPYSELHLGDFRTFYSRGTSVVFQNMIFAPVRRARPGSFSHRNYADLLPAFGEARVRELKVWANIGASNNVDFLNNDFEFEVRYGHQLRPDDPYRSFNIPNIIFRLNEIPSDTFIHQALLPSLPRRGYEIPGPAYLYRAKLDLTHPTVVRHIADSIRSTITTLPSDVSYLVGGEYQPYVPHPVVQGMPATNYAPHCVVGFQRWLQQKYRVIAKLNRDWHLRELNLPPYRHFSKVDATNLRLDNVPQAIRDYIEFQTFTNIEVQLHQYHVAKELRPRQSFGILSFGVLGAERSWLSSDHATQADWYGNVPGYFRRLGNGLQRVANAARYSGRPLVFGVSSPPTELSGKCRVEIPPRPPYSTMPPEFLPRCIGEDQFWAFFADVLPASTVHVGYYKAPGRFGFFGSETMETWLLVLDELKAIQPRWLAFMTPYQRVALHVDAEQADTLQSQNRVASLLAIHFDETQCPYGIFTDMRVMRRPFSRSLLGRSLIVSSFHRDLSSTVLDEFVQVVAGKGGRAIALTGRTRAAELLRYLQSRGRIPPVTQLGRFGRAFPWDAAGSCWVCYWPDEPVPPREEYARRVVFPDLQLALEQQLEGGTREPTRVFEVTPRNVPPSAFLTTSFVSDGLGFFCIVTNRSDDPGATATFDLAVAPRVRTLLGSSIVEGWDLVGSVPPLRLRPRESKRIYFRPRLNPRYALNPSDLATLVAISTRALRKLETKRFDVRPGLELLAAIERVHVTEPARALAGLVQLRRMMFLRTERSRDRVLVEAVYVPIGGPPQVPVAKAEIQVLHLLNAHEEQDAGRLRNGRATVTIAPVRQPRWNFDTQDYHVPRLDPATEPVEVHVHDPATGAHALAVV